MLMELKTVINFFNDTNCSHLIKKEIVKLYCNYGTSITHFFKKEITKYLDTNNYTINNNHSRYFIKTNHCYQDLQLINQPNSSYPSIMLTNKINNMDDIIIYISMMIICILSLIILISLGTNYYCCKYVSFRKYKRYRNVNLFVNDYEDY